MDKRQQIGRALRFRAIALWTSKSNDEETNYGWHPGAGIEAAIDALTDQAIVIECEVEHRGREETAYTMILGPGLNSEFCLPGWEGTPGKAIAIIIS